VHHIRPLFLGDEVPGLVLGQAAIYGSQDLGMLSLGIEILQLCPQAGGLLGGVVKEIIRINRKLFIHHYG